MIKTFRIFLLFVFVSQLVNVMNAQTSETIIIKGVVESELGNPIVGANVKVMDLGSSGLIDSTVTDVLGSYYLEFPAPTSVEKNEAIPNSFSLSQNYPNPFNKNTNIDFTTENQGNAKLEVFNVIGQKVITLFDNNISSNRVTVNWNGRNFNGNKLASGIYIYRLTFNGKIISKKMLLNSGELRAPTISAGTHFESEFNNSSLSKVTESYYFQIKVAHPTIVTIIDTLETNPSESTYTSNYFAAYNNFTGYPSDIISFFGEWKITLGSGSTINNLINYENEDYFYNANDGTGWVVYKTPNSGGTTPNSSNTRSELRQLSEWTPETGGKLTATLKVMHVSTTGDVRVPATFSTVVGQIHGAEGHKNEPLKIFYKKFPGQAKGSVFWNYEINTEGDNSERWDYSTAVWGYDWSAVGVTEDSYPEEPVDGIELGEEFSYEVNVYEGIMYLKFMCDGHETKTFTKNLITSEYTDYSDIPEQVLTVFSSTGQDGTEQVNAYSGEMQYFKQGAYNQTNGKNPADNMIWNTGAETYEGDLNKQYENGSYTEVWFKEATVGAPTEP